jgi:hypothetical protein
MPVADCPPAIVQPDQVGKRFCVYHGRYGWYANISGHAYPFGAWRMDRGPYPFRWMALLEFPIERLTKDGPRR